MRQIHSLITTQGTLELSIADVDPPIPGDDEILVRVEAAPINPSDIRPLLATAKPSTLTLSDDGQTLTGEIHPKAVAAFSARVGQPLTVGNEGSGVVVNAGSSPEAQALVGRTVSVSGGSMYSEFCVVPVSRALPVPDGTDPKKAAALFVNPLTALGMTATMRNEGHRAIVLTAAASNLGQMLNKICIADDIPLVSIVRKDEHVDLLRSIGADHVVNSSSESFHDDLVDALVETGATLAFDATGGGELPNAILSSMEKALTISQGLGHTSYGSSTHKQVYIFGGLQRGLTTLDRSYGMAWGLGGWLLTPFLAGLDRASRAALQQRIIDEIDTTFASSYVGELSLEGVLDPANVAVYTQQATGEKFLVTPQA